MNRIALAAFFVFLLSATYCEAGLRDLLAPKGPGTRYYYPLFREGNRPEAVRREAGAYYRNELREQWYPKYYESFHVREMQRAGRPPGLEGFRGYAW